MKKNSQSSKVKILDVNPGPNVIDIPVVPVTENRLAKIKKAVEENDGWSYPEHFTGTLPAPVHQVNISQTKGDLPTEVLKEVDRLLGEVTAGEAMLDVNWMKLGTLLEEVQTKEYWRGRFKSFGAYLMELQVRYKRGRSQLYNYIATAHSLRPTLTEEQLIQMGIVKARVLTEGLKAYGSIPPAAIQVALDKDKTVENLREALFKESNQQEKGEWFPLTGFPVTTEERATLNDFFEVAKRTDPVIPKEYKPWQVLKEILLRGAMEYLSSHPEVETFGEEETF